MSNDLLASLKDLITPELTGKAASLFGDPEPAVSKGMSAAFPVLLSGLAHRSSDSAFASTLYDLVRDPANDGGLLNNVGSLLAPGAASTPMGALGGKLLAALFGNNLGNLASSLSGFAGVKPSSGSSILSFAAPLVLSLLGRAVRSGNLSLSSLVALLTGQKATYASALPGPLARIETYLAGPAAERHVAPPPPPPPPPPKSSIWRWLLPLLIALAVLWLLSRCMGGREETTSMAPAPAPAETAPAQEPMPAPMPEATTEELPVANFYFEVDKFELPVAREGSLQAVIDYVMANPTAVAVISGYHDPTGDKAHNEELAKQRAQTVKDAMMAAGVPESQIDMVKPIETTGTGDMAEARRVEVSIRP
jgi:outer membrane protein OmpA-like peptidoglycan-associated protein